MLRLPIGCWILSAGEKLHPHLRTLQKYRPCTVAQLVRDKCYGKEDRFQ
jgi:hypothetical protein